MRQVKINEKRKKTKNKSLEICLVQISSYIYDYSTVCAEMYYYFNFIFEICMALCSTILDIASFVKLRSSKPANNAKNIRRKQEIIMLIQVGSLNRAVARNQVCREHHTKKMFSLKKLNFLKKKLIKMIKKIGTTKH